MLPLTLPPLPGLCMPCNAAPEDMVLFYEKLGAATGTQASAGSSISVSDLLAVVNANTTSAGVKEAAATGGSGSDGKPAEVVAIHTK